MSKHAPVVLQLSDTECGVASLAMLFAYYKVYVPLEALRDQCSASRDGCRAQTLINVAIKHGFLADAYQIDVATASQLSAPVIAHWNFSHYIVINEFKNGKVYINDPAFGAMTITPEEFNRSFTGVIINLTPTIHTVKNKRADNILKMIRFATSRFYTDNLFAALCLLITLISPYFILSLIQVLINTDLSANDSISSILILIVSMLYGIYFSATYLYKTSQLKLITKVSLSQIASITDHILKLPLVFYSLRQRSEIIAIALRIESFIDLLLKSLTNAFISTITSLACLTFMAKMNGYITLIIVAITSIYLTLNLIINKLLLSHEKTNILNSAKLQQHTLTSLKNMETIHACSLQDNTLRRWNMLFSKKIHNAHKADYIKTIKSTLEKSHHALSIFAILLISASDISNLLIYYCLQLVFHKNINIIFGLLIDIQTSSYHFNRINDINLCKIDTRYNQPDTTIQYTDSSDVAIYCSNVSFYYNDHEHPTLHNISLTIKQHQHIAFIGQTGSGKSTLAKLLCGLYQSHHGDIIVFDNKITTLSARELARVFAYVSQDVSLFSGTLFENVTYGKEVNITEISVAINVACLDKLVNERGLYAIVEENGRNFSGGEKQRIDIARALLQNTPILILDEATSALDNETQTQLINNLRAINKTIIFVAHRLESINHCDQIFTLINGKIIHHDTRKF